LSVTNVNEIFNIREWVLKYNSKLKK
jgi:hypothetical protein